MKYPEFANRFREAVRLAKVDDTQEALAKLLGVSGVMIWSYRNGEKLPRMSTAVRIAEKLGVEVNWLLSGTGDKGNGAGRDRGLDPVAAEAVEIAAKLLPGEWAYIKEQAAHLIARRMQGGPPVAVPATAPGLQNVGMEDAETITATRLEKENREANAAAYNEKRGDSNKKSKAKETKKKPVATDKD